MLKSGKPDFGCREGIQAPFVAGNILIMWASASGFHRQFAHVLVGEPESTRHHAPGWLAPAPALRRAP
jgi:hypothetical protein